MAVSWSARLSSNISLSHALNRRPPSGSDSRTVSSKGKLIACTSGLLRRGGRRRCAFCNFRCLHAANRCSFTLLQFRHNINANQRARFPCDCYTLYFLLKASSVQVVLSDSYTMSSDCLLRSQCQTNARRRRRIGLLFNQQSVAAAERTRSDAA